MTVSGLRATVGALTILLLPAACATTNPLLGTWESIALEGRTLQEQDVAEMRFVIDEESVSMRTVMRSRGEEEIDGRAFPYRIEGDRILLQPTSSTSGETFRYRLRGDTLVFQVEETSDDQDVRIHLIRARR